MTTYYSIVFKYFSICILLTGAVHSDVLLVEEGVPRAVIVLPDIPAEEEQLAAEEFIEHIKKISGAELSVLNEPHGIPDSMIPIFIGTAAEEALIQPLSTTEDNYSSFVLEVKKDQISIRGLHPEGTLFGVYEILEQLGVRWFMAIDIGTVIPNSTTIRLTEQETIQVPSMEFRRISHGGAIPQSEWFKRNRVGGKGRSTGSHSIPPFRNNQALFESHPEYYSLIGGERQFRQLCASNPEAVALTASWIRERNEPTDEKIYFGMGPDDGERYCECSECVALDGDVYDPLYGEIAVTGRYITFFNRLLDLLEDDFPNLHIAWYVYARHMMPPPENLQPNPRIVHVFAPITLDRTRGMDNPMSPDRHILRHVVNKWSERNPNEMYYRGYYNNLACPQFPFSQIDRIQNEIPALHALGVNVMRVQAINHSWASTPITLYLALRKMWDVDVDINALLEDFYSKFFGPAMIPMRAYFTGLESAFAETPYITGSSYLYFPIFDDVRRANLRTHLGEAMEIVTNSNDVDAVYEERVLMIERAYHRLELFLDMIDSRNNHDYLEAHRYQEAYYEITDAMIAKNWLANFNNVDGDYYRRFFRPAVDSGYERTVSIGELVTGLPDEWDFLLDVGMVGEIARYYRPGELGGNWQKIKTTSRSWSDQGLHYYKGDAWYRTHVIIPEAFEGREIYLWFGGVDNEAKVWVNGTLLGTNREPLDGLPGETGTFRPFDFRATNAIHFGEVNTVTVKATNDRLSEIGTGGIVAPVMFWSPYDSSWLP